MIELLILFVLKKSVLTMYGISKEISENFSVFTIPSFGTIKPALRRLEMNGAIKTQKTMSKGGRPSVYYSITSAGDKLFTQIMVEPPLDNPSQFLNMARIKLICANYLDNEGQVLLINNLLLKAQSILFDAQNMINHNDLAYYPRIVFDSIVCEYTNFISLLEGVKHASRCE